MANNETCFSHFFGLFEAIAREYILVLAIEVPGTVRLILGMKLLTIYSVSEVGSEHKVCFGASLRLTKVF